MSDNRPILVCMRLADMKRVHPQQVLSECARCGHTIGIYPSGQKIIEQTKMLYPDGVEVVCQVCHQPAPGAALAPGAEFEPFQSVKKKDQ